MYVNDHAPHWTHVVPVKELCDMSDSDDTQVSELNFMIHSHALYQTN